MKEDLDLIQLQILLLNYVIMIKIIVYLIND